MKLEIKKFPDSILRKKCSKIKKIDQSIRELAENMIETMKKEEGIGLTGTQVGIAKQIFVTNVDGKEKVFINPKITKRVGKEVMQEGCLSLPGLQFKIQRAEKIEIKALNKKGGKIKLEAEGLFAVCLQHEFDYLKGVLIIDYNE